jgi:hypothetical protein
MRALITPGLVGCRRKRSGSLKNQATDAAPRA